jgi:hypothetical protein
MPWIDVKFHENVGEIGQPLKYYMNNANYEEYSNCPPLIN